MEHTHTSRPPRVTTAAPFDVVNSKAAGRETSIAKAGVRSSEQVSQLLGADKPAMDENRVCLLGFLFIYYFSIDIDVLQWMSRTALDYKSAMPLSSRSGVADGGRTTTVRSRHMSPNYPLIDPSYEADAPVSKRFETTSQAAARPVTAGFKPKPAPAIPVALPKPKETVAVRNL